MTPDTISTQASGLVSRLLLGDEGRRNPHRICAELRSLGSVLPTSHGIWFTTSYAVSREVLRGAQFTRGGIEQRAVRDPRLRGSRLDDWERAVLPFIDAPQHTRLRRLVGGALTVQYMENQRPAVRRFVRQVLTAARDAGQVDLVRDLAAPLPFWITAEMFGIPEDDRSAMRQWTVARAETLQRTTAGVSLEGTNQALAESEAYLLDLIEDRRRHPGGDLLTRMIDVEVGGDKLTDFEIAANVNQLFSAGLDTVKYLVGNTLLALLQNPDQLAVLTMNPSIAANAVEETLRYEGGMTLAPARVPHEDIELGDHRIPAGSRICPVLLAANRDPAQFREPDRFLVARPNPRPLTFGGGLHRCLGAALARVQAQETLTSIAHFHRANTVSVDRAAFSSDPHRRGPEELSVEVSARRGNARD